MSSGFPSMTDMRGPRRHNRRPGGTPGRAGRSALYDAGAVNGISLQRSPDAEHVLDPFERFAEDAG
jgi:hypothetical protein